MKIAIVGKGGSGKTTISALFSSYISTHKKTLLIDADINVHLPQLFLPNTEGIEALHISSTTNSKDIKQYLIGENKRIISLDTFRKTTPPGEGSNFVVLGNNKDYIISKYTLPITNNLNLMVVGTYSGDSVGTSCYHNNLAVLENVLSHMKDQDGICIVDMVAGTDAFASSLHMQFDITVLVIEPTRKGLELWKQYQELSKTSGTYGSLFVVINKVEENDDVDFVKNLISKDKILGFLTISKYIKNVEKYGGIINFLSLEDNNKEVFSVIRKLTETHKTNTEEKLHSLYELHKKYVNQGFIKDRFGDLSGQIDDNFNPFDEKNEE